MTEEFAFECIKAGADDYILKTSLKRFPSSIQKLIAKKEIVEMECQLREYEQKSKIQSVHQHTICRNNS